MNWGMRVNWRSCPVQPPGLMRCCRRHNARWITASLQDAAMRGAVRLVAICGPAAVIIGYTPENYRAEEALPLLVVLHGCRQTQHDICAISGFDRIADRERFIVVYPFQLTGYLTPRNRNCWGWWMSIHIRAGGGEVQDVRRIIEQTRHEFSVDPQRIHITGLSSGAAMSVAALVAHGSLFASGASVAGIAYGESRAGGAYQSLAEHSLSVVAGDDCRDARAIAGQRSAGTLAGGAVAGGSGCGSPGGYQSA
ncbi:MAG: PHB depolymerase family esterase [Thiolinea sp.]